MKTDKRIVLVSLVIFLCIGCDQTTKTIAGRTLAVDKPVELLGDVVHLEYSENHGAMLGLGAELPAGVRFWLFTVFAGCALLGILTFTIASGRLTPASIISLSLVLGGMSNLIDRLLKGGVIIDFDHPRGAHHPAAFQSLPSLKIISRTRMNRRGIRSRRGDRPVAQAVRLSAFLRGGCYG